MSLKDKAFEAIPKNGIHPEVTRGMFTDKVVKLSDAEEEIEKEKSKAQWLETLLKDQDENVLYKDKEIETAQSTITSQAIQLERKNKEIQTLVELLAGLRLILKDSIEAVEYLRGDGLSYEEVLSSCEWAELNELEQTLKKYENRG